MKLQIRCWNCGLANCDGSCCRSGSSRRRHGSRHHGSSRRHRRSNRRCCGSPRRCVSCRRRHGSSRHGSRRCRRGSRRRRRNRRSLGSCITVRLIALGRACEASSSKQGSQVVRASWSGPVVEWSGWWDSEARQADCFVRDASQPWCHRSVWCKPSCRRLSFSALAGRLV